VRKIRVIHPGVADEFFSATPETAADVRPAVRPGHPYVLFVGIIEPRKNLDVLLDACGGLPASFRGENQLVIAERGLGSPVYDHDG
jgi:glycosyltransferase involved in cell wall biosynthesis